MAECVAKHCFELELENGVVYVHLGINYAFASKWNQATSIRNLMKGQGMRISQNVPGFEIDNKILFLSLVLVFIFKPTNTNSYPT